MSLSSPVQNLAIHLILSVVGFCFCSYYCFFARSLKLHRRLCCLDVLVSGLLVIGSNFTCMSGWRAICISAMCAFVQTMRVRNVHTWTGPGEIKMHMHWLWVMWMRRLSSFSSAFSLSLSLVFCVRSGSFFVVVWFVCACADTLRTSAPHVCRPCRNRSPNVHVSVCWQTAVHIHKADERTANSYLQVAYVRDDTHAFQHIGAEHIGGSRRCQQNTQHSILHLMAARLSYTCSPACCISIIVFILNDCASTHTHTHAPRTRASKSRVKTMNIVHYVRIRYNLLSFILRSTTVRTTLLMMDTEYFFFDGSLLHVAAHSGSHLFLWTRTRARIALDDLVVSLFVIAQSPVIRCNQSKWWKSGFDADGQLALRRTQVLYSF